MKMKSAIAVFGALGIILSGCSSIKIQHVDAQTFLRYAEPMNGMYSAEYTTYIGSTRNNAYVEHKNYITFIRKSPVTTVYWTELDSLPNEISEKIKLGQAPWTPFDHSKVEMKRKFQDIQIDVDRTN